MGTTKKTSTSKKKTTSVKKAPMKEEKIMRSDFFVTDVASACYKSYAPGYVFRQKKRKYEGITLILSGTMEWVGEGEETLLEAGDLLLQEQNDRYQLKVVGDEPAEYMVISYLAEPMEKLRFLLLVQPDRFALIVARTDENRADNDIAVLVKARKQGGYRIQGKAVNFAFLIQPKVDVRQSHVVEVDALHIPADRLLKSLKTDWGFLCPLDELKSTLTVRFDFEYF